jgi:hypothetical protein
MTFFASLISQQKRNDLSHPEAENEAHFWPDFVHILPSINNLLCLFDQQKKESHLTAIIHT